MVERFTMTSHPVEGGAMDVHPHGDYVLYSDFAELAAENERLTASWRKLDDTANEWADRAHQAEARAEAAKRALAERSGGRWQVKDYADGWIDFDTADAALAEVAAMGGALVRPLITEPAAPEGRQEAVAYLSSCVLSSFDPNGTEIVDAMLFPKGCLRPNQEVAIYTRPSEHAVTEAARRVLEWVYPIAGDNRDEAQAKEEIESVEALKAAMEAGR